MRTSRSFLFLLLSGVLLVGCFSSKDDTGDSSTHDDREHDCGDGEDNDQDGAYDCDDPDCAGSSDCETDTDTDADSDTDTDADADADADSDTDVDLNHPYTHYEGTQILEFGFGQIPGSIDCAVVWTATGTPINACAGCEFAFDVTLSYDSDSSEIGHGHCHHYANDLRYSYAFIEDYQGYGSYALMDYYGSWYLWASASFSAGTFSYSVGLRDFEMSHYGYPGYYYTLYWTGSAEVE